MPRKPNYSYERYQRERAKAAKRQAKADAKAEAKALRARGLDGASEDADAGSAAPAGDGAASVTDRD